MKLRRCNCQECLKLDARWPEDGFQWMLIVPEIDHHRAGYQPPDPEIGEERCDKTMNLFEE